MTSSEAFWRLLSGFTAGVASRSFIAPIERYIILKQTKSKVYHSKGLLRVLVLMYRREGIRGFFKGNGANCLRAGPFQALEFSIFDTFKNRIVPILGVNKNISMLFFGACASTVGTIAVYPFDLLRTVLAVEGN